MGKRAKFSLTIRVEVSTHTEKSEFEAEKMVGVNQRL